MVGLTALSRRLEEIAKTCVARGDDAQTIPQTMTRETGVALWEAERICVRLGVIRQQEVDEMRAGRRQARGMRADLKRAVALVRAGASYSDAARKVGGISRNAVAGACCRVGLVTGRPFSTGDGSKAARAAAKRSGKARA